MSSPLGPSWSTKYTIGDWSAVNNGQPYVDADNAWWSVTTEQGWSGSPAPRSAVIDREQSDGAFDGPTWQPGRVITLAGKVRTGDQLTLQRKIDQINALLVAPPRLLPLVVAEAHLTRQTLVRRQDETLAAKSSPFEATWRMVLYAADSIRYSATLNHVPTGLYSGANGRAYTRAYPVAYGSLGNQGLAAIHNSGNLDAYPVLTLSAPTNPLVNPQVRLVGGSLIRLGLTVAVGDTIAIDLAAETVMLNGVATRTGAVTADSAFFSCPKGDSQLLFTADSGIGALLDAAWRDPYA